MTEEEFEAYIRLITAPYKNEIVKLKFEIERFRGALKEISKLGREAYPSSIEMHFFTLGKCAGIADKVLGDE